MSPIWGRRSVDGASFSRPRDRKRPRWVTSGGCRCDGVGAKWGCTSLPQYPHRNFRRPGTLATLSPVCGVDGAFSTPSRCAADGETVKCGNLKFTSQQLRISKLNKHHLSSRFGCFQQMKRLLFICRHIDDEAIYLGLTNDKTMAWRWCWNVCHLWWHDDCQNPSEFGRYISNHYPLPVFPETGYFRYSKSSTNLLFKKLPIFSFPRTRICFFSTRTNFRSTVGQKLTLSYKFATSQHLGIIASIVAGFLFLFLWPLHCNIVKKFTNSGMQFPCIFIFPRSSSNIRIRKSWALSTHTHTAGIGKTFV